MMEGILRLPETGEVIYIIEYGIGAVKVGYTSQPRKRMQAHERAARQLGTEIVQFWVSPAHVNARMNERRVIKFCSERADRTTGNEHGEYFANLDLDEVREFTRTLPFEAPVEQSAPEPDCPACLVVDARPLSALALLNQVAHGQLRIFDAHGNDVSEVWAGNPVATH